MKNTGLVVGLAVVVFAIWAMTKGKGQAAPIPVPKWVNPPTYAEVAAQAANEGGVVAYDSITGTYYVAPALKYFGD